MKKILFIDLSDYFIYQGNHRPMSMITLPLGLMSLGTFLQSQFDLEVKIIKSGIDFLTEDEAIEVIASVNFDYIGIRSLSISADELYQLSHKIKEKFPNLFLMIGGPHASSAYKDVIENTPADAVIVGEGELTLKTLISKLLNNEDYRDLPGLAVRKDGQCIFNGPGEFIHNLDQLPFPNYALIDLDKYANKMNWASVRRKNALIESSRGCPYSCIFCHNLFGQSLRFRSPRIIFSEMERLHKKLAINDFFFIDDAFNLNYEVAMELFDKIIDSKIKINLHFTNGLRGDRLDQKFIDKMVEAGTATVAYAVETASPRLQRYINKNLNLQKIEENINYSCDRGIMVRLFFMFGFPTETKAEVEATLLMMKKFKKCLPMFYATKYYKNTKLYEMAIQEGFSRTEMEKVESGGYHQIEFCATPLLSPEFMKKIHFRYLTEVLFNKERMQNTIEIQKKYFSEDEIKDFYSDFLMRDIKNLDSLMSLCR
ncbi:MAG TPA: radical SAM protein [Patescibacteria group bacterium]|nr:radical SAM protein [Patescibacteria group bacterium]